MYLSNFTYFLSCYFKRNKYPPFVKSQKNVIVTLTTTPSRINKMWPTLNSIVKQSIQPEKIHLWIPKKFKRFPQDEMLQLPDFIKNNPMIHVEFIEQDYGPATKLLPCLQSEALQNKKIIVIDDDRIYPRHLIRDLLHYEQQEPSAAIGVAGTVVFGAGLREYRATKKLAKVDVLLGYNAYLVKPQFFSKATFDYPECLPEAFFEDDVWFSGHMKNAGIRRILIPSNPSTQNIMTSNKKTFGLCVYENGDKRNFLKIFDYFKTREECS